MKPLTLASKIKWILGRALVDPNSTFTVNNEFYPRWFLLDLLCLHSSVLFKNPVISFYLAGVSLNFPIFFCIKSLMLDLTNYIQSYTLLCHRICLPLSRTPLPTYNQNPFWADRRPRRGKSAAVYDMWDRRTKGGDIFEKPLKIVIT